jgi:hypothetical protein
MNWRKGTAIFLFTGLIFLIMSCRQAEKAAGQEEIRDRSLYKTEIIEGKETTYLAMDFSRLEKPAGVDEFIRVWAQPPIQQYKTLSCW